MCKDFCALRVVLLTAAELTLFKTLANQPGRWVSAQELMDATASDSASPGTVLRAMLSRIRREFKKAGLENPIEVTYRVGYRLKASALAVPVADRSAVRAAKSSGEYRDVTAIICR